MNDKKTYAQLLNEGSLSKTAINNISDFMISSGQVEMSRFDV